MTAQFPAKSAYLGNDLPEDQLRLPVQQSRRKQDNPYCPPSETEGLTGNLDRMLNPPGAPPGIGGVYAPGAQRALGPLRDRLQRYEQFGGQDVEGQFMEQARELLGRPALNLQEAMDRIWEQTPTDATGKAIEGLVKRHGLRFPGQTQEEPSFVPDREGY